MKQLSPLLIILTVLCAGCPRPIWLSDPNLKEYVQEPDVVGVWNLQLESLALLARDGFKVNSSQLFSIQFVTNGVCIFQSVADSFKGGVYHDVRGTWSLEHDTTGSSNIKTKNAIRMELPLPNTTSLRYLNFEKRDGRLILWSYYGDPDLNEFMKYKKAEQAGPGYPPQGVGSPDP